MLTARGHIAFIFETQAGVLVKVFETENVSTWGGLEPPTFGFMPNALTYCAIKGSICCRIFFNTGPGGIDIFLK